MQTAVWRVSTYGQGGTAIARRVDVKQAAKILGISSEGVRQRIRRGSLESEKDTDGRVYVFLNEEDVDDTRSEHDTHNAITRLENEVAFLRGEVATRDAEIQRRDAILMNMTEAMKALSPPQETPPGTPSDASESRKTAAEGEGRGNGRGESETGEKRRSWWRRMFE